jgi:hypothetical protein
MNKGVTQVIPQIPPQARAARWSWMLLALALVAGSVAAAEAPQQTAVVPLDSGEADDVTQELIRILSSRGLLTKEEAGRLIAKAREEAARRVAEKNAPTATTSAAAVAGATLPEPDKKGTVRVVYLPETEKARLREEVKNEVLVTAQQQNWAQPQAVPEWTKRISFFGDFRFRYEQLYYDNGNYPFFINYNAINNGAPYDVSQNNTQLPPLYNSTEDRKQPRVRLRFGAQVSINDQLSARLRFASGNNTNPVSNNQTLGPDFNKFSFVIDRAYLDYHPYQDVSGWLGRMEKPWLSTSLVWWEDLGFDGVAFQYRPAFTNSLSGFATAGVFSVENTALDFPSINSSKIASRDKWLYASQLGLEWNATPGLRLRGAAAYYYYDHLQGKKSSPCTPLTSSDPCDTDNSRPLFLQGGNTLFAIRDLVADPSNPNGPQYQYFGLASPFRLLDAIGEIDATASGPVHIVFTGEYVSNLGYDPARVLARLPVNNYSSDGAYHGGGEGYQLQILAGYPKLKQRWDWNLVFGYKRVESDAVVDAFDDPDLRYGGTNDKGYFVKAGLGLLPSTWLQARYFSATEVTGPPLSVDVFQLDLNADF